MIPRPPGHSLGPNVVHQHLVGRQLVLHGRPSVVGLFQPDPTAQLIEYLDPEAGLQMVGRECYLKTGSYGQWSIHVVWAAESPFVIVQSQGEVAVATL